MPTSTGISSAVMQKDNLLPKFHSVHSMFRRVLLLFPGGQVLVENVDYTIDYNLGTVKIINQAIINSGVPVTVQFENNAGFGIQQRNFMGLRLDYLAKNTARNHLVLERTMVRLGERPFFTKTNYNEDPIRNTMYGLDFNYRTEFPRLNTMAR